MIPKRFKAYEVAVGEIGVKEIVGGEHSKRVLEYHDTTDLDADNDETAWCASFVNWCLMKAGMKGTGKAHARSFLKIGKRVKNPKVGDLVVTWRGSRDSWMGHVGFFAGIEGKRVIILGGNQGNKVCYSHYPLVKVLEYRRV